MEGFGGTVGQCAICLEEITLEAFLDVCFHHFCLDCIKAWSDVQRSSRLTCPLCKRPYYSLIYDCHDLAFNRLQLVTPPPGILTSLASSAFQLTPELRRRRSLYFLPAPDSTPNNQQEQPTENDETEEQVPLSRANPRNMHPRNLTTALIERPVVFEFVKRELQAVLLEQDVDVIAHHALGTIAATLDKLKTAPNSHQTTGTKSFETNKVPADKKLKVEASMRSSSRETCCIEEEVERAIQAAVEPYLPRYTHCFAAQLVSFLQSGLSIAAFDAVCFHLDSDILYKERSIKEQVRGVRTRVTQQRRRQKQGIAGLTQNEDAGLEYDSSSLSEGRDTPRGFTSGQTDSEGYVDLALQQGRKAGRKVSSDDRSDDGVPAEADR